MSDQTFASPGDPYWLSSRGVDKVSFNKQAAPPLAYLDKGILYELDSGGIWFNGVRLDNGGGSGDVSSNSKPCRDLAIPVFDGTTGEEIKQSVLSVSEPTAEAVVLRQWDGFSNINILRNDTDFRNLTLGTNAGPSSMLTNGTEYSVIIGHQAGGGSSNPALTESVFAGYRAGYSAGAGGQITALGAEAYYSSDGSANTTIGYQSLYRCNTSYNTAAGWRSQNNLSTADGVGIAPNTTYGALSMLNPATGNGNNAFGFRALEGVGGQVADGVRLNNAVGNYNGLSATDGFENNVMIGNSVLNSAATAIGNVIVGNSAGEGTGGGSNYNIYLGNGAGISALGVESRTIRIGASTDNTVYPYAVGKPNRCFIQGIYGVSAHTGEHETVHVDSEGKLHTTAAGEAMPIGEIYFENNTLYSLPLTVNVAAQITPTTTLVQNVSFSSPSAGNLRYTGVHTRLAHVALSLSGKNAVGSNQQFEYELRLNGVKVPGSGFRQRFASTTEYNSIAFHKAVSLSTNDVLSIWCTNQTASNGIEIFNFNLVAVVAH